MARLQTRVKADVLQISSNVVLGMNLRQVIFSALAIVSAGISYFLLKDLTGVTVATYISAFFAMIFALLGFFNYNGLTAEKFLMAVWKDLNAPKILKHKSTNYFYNISKQYQKEKEEYLEYEEYLNKKKHGSKEQNTKANTTENI